MQIVPTATTHIHAQMRKCLKFRKNVKKYATEKLKRVRQAYILVLYSEVKGKRAKIWVFYCFSQDKINVDDEQSL